MVQKTTLKTVANENSVTEFINSLDNNQQKQDALALVEIYKSITGLQPVMWGSSIIGFGKYSYTRSDKKTFEMAASAFSPRKNALTIYIIPYSKSYDEELKALGKYTVSKGCLYIKKLNDINLDILQLIIKKTHQKMNGTHFDYGTFNQSSKKDNI